MHTVSESNNVKRRLEQFPVDVKIRGYRFETDVGDLLRIVVMSDNVTTLHAQYREYHHGNNAVFVDSVGKFALRSTILGLSPRTSRNPNTPWRFDGRSA